MKQIILTFSALLFAFWAYAFSPVSGPSVVCVSSTETYTDSSIGGNWSSSNISVATIGSASGLLTAISSGTVTVTYTVGVNSATETITVNPYPTSFTLNASATICAGDSGTHLILSGSSSGVSYQLYQGMGSTGPVIYGTGTTLDMGLQTIPGTYTVRATDTTTGCSQTMAGHPVITVNSAITAIYGPSELCQGTTLTLSNITAGGTWASGSPAVASVDPATGVVSGVSAGSSVIYYSFTSTGCYAAALVSVDALPCSNVSVKETSLPDNSLVEIYPVPASGSFTITSAPGAYNHYTITGMEGKIIKEEKIITSPLQADISSLPDGLYLLTFYGSDGTKVLKLQKRQ